MTEQEELLVILMEECSEVIQEASKMIRFMNKNPYRIEKEIGDLLCMIELLSEYEMIDPSILEDHIQSKRDKLKKWSSLQID